MERELHILYTDDEHEFIAKFEDRHKRFKVTPVRDVDDVLPTLKRCKQEGRLPNLLLLDLYHDLDLTTDDHARRIEEGKQALDELQARMRDLRSTVSRAWQPSALATIEEVREHFSPSELPIMIYSQRGLMLLDDDQLRRIEEADADWMLKDRGQHYEVQRIRRIVEERPRKRLERDVTIAAISLVVGIASSLAIQFLAS